MMGPFWYGSFFVTTLTVVTVYLLFLRYYYLTLKYANIMSRINWLFLSQDNCHVWEYSSYY